MIKRVKLFINNNEKSKNVAKEVEKELINKGFEIVNDNPELCISIGGDGSFLRMLKSTKFDTNMLYVGINSGTLGFLQEIDVDKTKDFVERLANEQYKVESINIQETNVKTDKDLEHFYSLNEIVVRNRKLSTLKIKIYVDNEFLEEFIGDGVLISTSTGSTAYNMTYGGSIIYNTLNTLSITPIAPQNNKIYNTLRNTIVIPGDRKIRIETEEGYDDLFVHVDGVNNSISNVESIKTFISNKTIKCLRMEEFHFIKIVNNKLVNK